MEVKLEEKFIVINRKYLKSQQDRFRIAFYNALYDLTLPDNKYYVCNQDEPYAQEVINIILKGEKKNVPTKHQTTNKTAISTWARNNTVSD